MHEHRLCARCWHQVTAWSPVFVGPACNYGTVTVVRTEGCSVNKRAVLVPAAKTESHSLGALDNRHVYFAALEFKIKALAIQVPRERTFLLVCRQSSCYFLMWVRERKRERSFLSCLFFLATNLIHEGSTLTTLLPPNASPP